MLPMIVPRALDPDNADAANSLYAARERIKAQAGDAHKRPLILSVVARVRTDLPRPGSYRQSSHGQAGGPYGIKRLVCEHKLLMSEALRASLHTRCYF